MSRANATKQSTMRRVVAMMQGKGMQTKIQHADVGLLPALAQPGSLGTSMQSGKKRCE